MHDALARALDAGATVVTPNRRLARTLVDEHDRAQRAAGRIAWPSARVLPWPAFVLAIADEAVVAGALPPRIVASSRAAAYLWRAAIAADASPVPDPEAMAEAAAEAWEHVHAYGAGGPSWQAWTERSDEPATFARWADRYATALARLGASDVTLEPDRIAGVASDVPAWRGRRIAFAGFLEPTPQQRRFADALTRAGATVEWVVTVDGTRGSVRRAACASPDDELVAALVWARGEIERRPDARIAIVVPDLAARRAVARMRAIDVLGIPDAGAPNTAPAWNVSLGAPIDDVPLVRAALDLAALAWGALPAGRAAALLRHPALPGAQGANRLTRAAAERRWLEDGVEPVTLRQAIAFLTGAGDPLAARFDAVLAIAASTVRASRHGWVDAWRSAWHAVGWPGEGTRSSDEHQALRALDEHLAAFAAVDAVATGRGAEIGAADALAELATILASSPFQPESAPAPVQILGLYEAIGLRFDALWVTGMDDATLPRAPRPHPLLPVAWQREHGVPRSDAARELAFARDVADTLLRGAPSVVVSHAKVVDDRPALPSAMFATAGAIGAQARPAMHADAMFRARPAAERMVDAHAPALVVGTHSGGSGVLQAQSDCPFQALAAHRWKAERWPSPIAGLTPPERGTLLHDAFASFWRATRTHAALAALAADARALADACGLAADDAIKAFDPARWRRLPRAVRAAERGRLGALLAAWLTDIEVPRAPFHVVDTEADRQVAVGPMSLRLRLDRVDAPDDGGAVIVDYKTGRVPSAARWRGARPDAVQVALYVLAWRALHPGETVRGAVLAQVRRGESKPVGLYADAQTRLGKPPSRGPDRAIVADWPALEAEWEVTTRALAEAFVAGDAPVAPRKLALCRTCARHALCRIGAVDEDDDDDEDAEP